MFKHNLSVITTYIMCSFSKLKNLNIPPEMYSISLIFIVFTFCIIQTENLYSLPWDDEFSYLNPILLEVQWSFFLPWNYRPEYFMGHPMGQPLVLWAVFNLFAENIIVAKTAMLGYSLLCLFTLYKMTKTLFQNNFTAFCSVIFTISLPLFWLHSTLILAHIPLMAFGFGTIYAFTAKQYKTLLLFSLGLATIRESALAFFLPLILQGIFIPVHRKSLYCIIPSFLIFFSHFFIFFIRTGHWIAHPYIYGGLPHKLNPVFFNFSRGWERLPQFINELFHQCPLLFYLLLISGVVLIIKIFFKTKKDYVINSILKINIKECFNKTMLMKLKTGVASSFFTHLSICALFFIFWITYPEFDIRNFFPLIVLCIPLSTYVIVTNIPLSRFFLIAVSFVFFLNMIYPGTKVLSLISQLNLLNDSPELVRKNQETLEAKSFVTFLESNYGHKIKYMDKRIYMPYPYDQTMRHPFFGYVKNSYLTDHWRFFENPAKYGIVALAFKKRSLSHLPYNQSVHKYLLKSESFTEIPLPINLKDFILFVHKDLLSLKKQKEFSTLHNPAD